MLAGMGGVPPTDRSPYATFARTTGPVCPATKVENVTLRSGYKGSCDQVQITVAVVLSLLVVVSRNGAVADVGSVAWHLASPYAPSVASRRPIWTAASVAPSAAYAVLRWSPRRWVESSLAYA